MIYTLTFNPAVDYILNIEDFALCKVNRADEARIHFGGKGINVSTVLNGFGIDNIAFGFVAGFTGTELEQSLREKGIRTDFIHLPQGATRINVKISGKNETEANAAGPSIDNDSLVKLFDKLDLVKKGDILIISGSVPASLSSETYAVILQRLSGRGITFVIDAVGELLLNTLKQKPFLIKPSLTELQFFSEKKFENDSDIITVGKQLQVQGAQNVLISMGDRGAILICARGDVFKAEPQCVKTAYTVGAGDAMLAGFIAGYVTYGDMRKAFLAGSAAGNATAASEALAGYDEVLKCMDMMEENHNIKIIEI